MLCILTTLLSLTTTLSSAYTLQSAAKGQDLLNMFNFVQQNGGENGGIANYLSQNDAYAAGILSVERHGAVKLAVGMSQYQSPRDAIKIMSKKQYSEGLFIFDVAHIPAVCGTWASLWSVSTTATWPDGGEIDIIEGVHTMNQNAMSTHTAPGCYQDESSTFNAQFMMSSDNKNNCDPNQTSGQGCGVRSDSTASYGPNYNAAKGGVYALLWNDGGLSTYYWARGNVPDDIGSANPNPAGWGTPQNHVSPGSCNIGNHFQDHSLILNTNLCGTWGSGVWDQDLSYAGSPGSCAAKTGYSSCEAYVANNGGDFGEAYWQINSIKIYSPW